jgi:hypothetical protein
MNDWPQEEPDDPLYADRLNFYKVEKWSGDGLRVVLLLSVGNNLDKARRVFECATKNRQPIRLMIRHRMRVPDESPQPRKSTPPSVVAMPLARLQRRGVVGYHHCLLPRPLHRYRERPQGLIQSFFFIRPQLPASDTPGQPVARVLKA